MNCLVYGEIFIAHMLRMCLGCLWVYVSVCISVRACVRLCVFGWEFLLGWLSVGWLARSLACVCVRAHLCARVHTIMWLTRAYVYHSDVDCAYKSRCALHHCLDVIAVLHDIFKEALMVFKSSYRLASHRVYVFFLIVQIGFRGVIVELFSGLVVDNLESTRLDLCLFHENDLVKWIFCRKEYMSIFFCNVIMIQIAYMCLIRLKSVPWLVHTMRGVLHSQGLFDCYVKDK